MSRMASMQVLNNAFQNLNNAMATIMQNNRQNRAMDIEERYKNDLINLRQDLLNRTKQQDLINLASTQGDAVANAYQRAVNGDPVAQNAMLKGIEENRQRQIRNAVYDKLIGNFDKLKEWKLKQEQNYLKNTLEADKFLWGVRKDKDAQRLELEKFQETQKQNKIKNDLNQKKGEVLTPEQVNNLVISKVITEEQARAYIQRHYPELQSQGDAKSKAQQMFSTKK